ncbi:MAG: DUF4143 domain-containing protein [Dactylosporangium sp.]|nr:DUF4143 domain-containing protein [Dactylosporangium sp.]NNJ60926.1 DUF4143 domain-containing protein [Dactylosporangium sp.]
MIKPDNEEQRRARGQPGTTESGSLFESFIISEIMKQAALAESELQLFHFRDRDGAEIDCVLETPDRRIVGIEIKPSMSVDKATFAIFGPCGTAKATSSPVVRSSTADSTYSPSATD